METTITITAVSNGYGYTITSTLGHNIVQEWKPYEEGYQAMTADEARAYAEAEVARLKGE